MALLQEDNAYGLSGTVIVILPVDSNEDLKALRRYSESPNPPTKTILCSTLVPVLSDQSKDERGILMDKSRGVAA